MYEYKTDMQILNGMKIALVTVIDDPTVPYNEGPGANIIEQVLAAGGKIRYDDPVDEYFQVRVIAVVDDGGYMFIGYNPDRHHITYPYTYTYDDSDECVCGCYSEYTNPKGHIDKLTIESCMEYLYKCEHTEEDLVPLAFAIIINPDE